MNDDKATSSITPKIPSKVEFVNPKLNGVKPSCSIEPESTKFSRRQLSKFSIEVLRDLHINLTEKLKELVNEDWDLVVIDDLFWSLGFSLTVLKYQLWEHGVVKKEPRFLVFATAGQTLMSAESVKSTGRNWVSKVPLFPYMPTDETDVYDPNKFNHRLHGFYENFAELISMNYLVENFLLTNITKFGVPNFSWYELYRRSSLQFTDSLDRLGWPLAIAPDVVGLGANCKSGKALSDEFKQFVEDPKSKGTIYVAFGTYPNWNYAPKYIIDALIGAFNRLTEYRVIFVYNGPPISAKSHIKLTKWAPQMEILAHPKTLAFISHGGMKSVKEGICGPTSLIIMPLFAEQAHNAHVVLALGIGPVINKYTLTEQSVFQTLDNVLSNPDSKKRANRIKRIFLDRPIPAMDEGIFFIERLLRRKEGKRINFLRHGMHLSWPQFLYFEPLLCFISMIFVLKQ